jgi:hypothetical protein
MDSYRRNNEKASILSMWLMDPNEFWLIDAHVAYPSDGSRIWTCQLSGVGKNGPEPQSDGVRAWPDWMGFSP